MYQGGVQHRCRLAPRTDRVRQRPSPSCGRRPTRRVQERVDGAARQERASGMRAAERGESASARKYQLRSPATYRISCPRWFVEGRGASLASMVVASRAVRGGPHCEHRLSRSPCKQRRQEAQCCASNPWMHWSVMAAFVIGLQAYTQSVWYISHTCSIGAPVCAAASTPSDPDYPFRPDRAPPVYDWAGGPQSGASFLVLLRPRASARPAPRRGAPGLHHSHPRPARGDSARARRTRSPRRRPDRHRQDGRLRPSDAPAPG